MKKKLAPWKTIPMVISLLVRRYTPTTEDFLVGLKKNGILKGYIAPPGGHVEESDGGDIYASRREVGEESGLEVTDGVIVGQFTVQINATRERRIVSVVKHTDWTGKLKADEKEFKWLMWRPVTDISTLKLPPGDLGWLMEALITKQLAKTIIICGKDRADLIRCKTERVEHL